jgi:NADH dehydrogenase [ubiquinone] 1 alpha subcomplex assembly factor 1
VRGDGRTYYFNINAPTLIPAFSYRARFDTKKGEWQEVQIPLKDFRATSFGQEIPGALDPAKVEAVGFLLADKKAGPFKLEVAWIKTVPKSAK